RGGDQNDESDQKRLVDDEARGRRSCGPDRLPAQHQYFHPCRGRDRQGESAADAHEAQSPGRLSGNELYRHRSDERDRRGPMRQFHRGDRRSWRNPRGVEASFIGRYEMGKKDLASVTTDLSALASMMPTQRPALAVAPSPAPDRRPAPVEARKEP